MIESVRKRKRQMAVLQMAETALPSKPKRASLLYNDVVVDEIVAKIGVPRVQRITQLVVTYRSNIVAKFKAAVKFSDLCKYRMDVSTTSIPVTIFEVMPFTTPFDKDLPAKEADKRSNRIVSTVETLREWIKEGKMIAMPGDAEGTVKYVGGVESFVGLRKDQTAPFENIQSSHDKEMIVNAIEFDDGIVMPVKDITWNVREVFVAWYLNATSEAKAAMVRKTAVGEGSDDEGHTEDDVSGSAEEK